MLKHICLSICCLLAWMVSPALAATNAMSAKMIEAAQLVVAGNYPQAVQVYSDIIAADPDNIDAYLQRAITRREMGDHAHALSDATIVVRLADAFMARKGVKAKLLYQRGSGLRLLKRFPEARRDLQRAIQLNKNNSWANDLAAIDLEEKMSKAQ